MPDQKPWERYQKAQSTQQGSPKPWERYQSEEPSKKKVESKSPGLGSSLSAITASTFSGFAEPKKAGQSVSSVSEKTDGIYKDDARPGATYKKEGDQWLIDVKGSGQFVPLTSGDVQQRVSHLEKNAKPYYGDEQWQTSPTQSKPTASSKEGQKLFDEAFAVLDKDDPEVKRRDEISKISNVASNLVYLQEEQAVPLARQLMAKNPENDIFDFEEYGSTDKMQVTNRLTGQKIVVDLMNMDKDDAENERKLLEAFLDVNLQHPEYNKLFKEKNDLLYQYNSADPMEKQKIRDRLDEVEGKLRVEEALRRGYAINGGAHTSAAVKQKDRVTWRSDQQTMQDDINTMEVRSMELKQKAKEIQEYDKWLSDGLKSGSITPEQYNERINDPLMRQQRESVKDDYDKIVEDTKYIAEKADQNDIIAAQAYEAMKNRGDAGSLAIAQFTKGFIGTYIGLMNFGKVGKDQTVLGTERFYEGLSDILPGELTEEYVNNPDLPAWQKALAGISESLGAALSMGPMGEAQALESLSLNAIKGMAVKEGIKKTAWEVTKNFAKRSMTPDQIGLFVNSYQNFKDQMAKDPDFENVPAGEQITMAAIYGFVSGKLEKYGLTKSLSKTPMGKNLNAYILSRVFKDLPKGAGSDVINTAIESQVKTLISKGVLNTAGAAFVEGSTEAAQEIADMTLKSAYNEIKGKGYFDTPETFAEALSQTGEAFKLGLVGGSMMNGISTAVRTPREIRTATQLQQLQETVSNPEIKKIFEENIKAKVINREITPGEAKAQLDELNESQALFEKIPDNVEDKAESFRLLADKQKLEKEIAGKDESLTVVQREKVRVIDERLAAISQEAELKTNGKDVVGVGEDQVVSKESSVSQFDSLIEAETIPERRSTLKAAKQVEGALGDTKIVVHQTSEDYANTINEFVTDKETPDNRTSGRFIPERNEIHIDLDTAEPTTAYHEAFHAKLRGVDQPTFKTMLTELNSVVKDDEGLLNRAQSFAEQYGDAELSEETLAELTGIMADTAVKLDKTRLQKFVEFVNKIATKIGLPSVLKKTASRGEVVSFMNDLSESFRTGKTAPVSKTETTEIVAKESARKITPERLQAIRVFDTDYEQKIQSGASPAVAFNESIEELEGRISDDILRESAIRDINRKYGKRIKSAPKVEKVLAKKKPKAVVVDEAKALVDQIKFEAKAAQDKKKQVKEVLTTISDSVKAMQTNGKLSIRQFSSIMSALKGMNMDNKFMVDKFVDYVGNVIAKAEFAEKQAQAATIRKQIKKSFKGKANPFVAVAKGFSEINPKWVDDIDEYLEVADKVKQSLRPTTVREGEIKFKKEADVQEVGAYVAQEQDTQMKIMEGNFRSEYGRITGKSAEGRDVADMKAEMFEKIDKGTEDYTDKIKDALKQRLDEFRQLTTADDPKEAQKATRIDVEILDAKTAIRILDALDSYIANGTTAGLRAQMSAYKGILNAKNSKLVTKRLRIAGLKYLGRLQNEQFTNMNILTERMFRGVNAAATFRKESGVQDIVNGANRAETETTQKQNEWLKKYKKVKDFQSAENIYERAVIAFLKRNVVAGDQQAEFDRRRSLLDESVETLELGTELERAKAKVYKKVLDRLKVSSPGSTMESIEKKAQKFNVDAVNDIIDMWSDRYADLSDFALGVHNIMLPRDINYTPDRFASTESNRSIEEAIDSQTFGLGAFSNLVLDKNEAGVLMESKKPKRLPKGRYIDLDFDSNMFRAYKLALTDMYTAEAVRQADRYMKSKEFQKAVVADDRNILETAVSDYVAAKKGRGYSDKDTLNALSKFNGFISSLGSARALAGLGQFVNQYSTAMTNTFFNTGINLRPWEIASKEAMEFVNRSGRAIANRGLEAVTTIENAEKELDRAKVIKGVQTYTTEPLAKANMFMLKWLLQKPDVFAARTAWLAYYRESMKKQGLEVDYSGEVNDKAADYAQTMVDRNMDVSDTELRGKFFRDKDLTKQFIKQVFFPFATFALNQKNRLWNDMSVAVSPVASNEDRAKARKSILALGAEVVVYNGIRYFIGKMVLEAAMSALGLDDEEKEAERERLGKYTTESVTGKMVQDIISPSPILDQWTLKAMNGLFQWSGVDGVSEEEFQKHLADINKERAENYEDPLTDKQIEDLRADFWRENEFQFYVNDDQSFGTLGIQGTKMMEAWDMYKAWSDGSYIQESDSGDHEKYLTKEGQDKMLNPFLLKLSASLVAPREADQIANRMFKIVKQKYGLTDSQMEKVNALQDQGYTVTDNMLKIIKAEKGVPRTVDGIATELDYMSKMSSKERKQYMADEFGL
jgi:hypothetical protein